MKKEKIRKFLGILGRELKLDTSQCLNKEDEQAVINEFKSNRHYYDRMLRAYLKGKTHFQYGFEFVNNLRNPIIHKVEYLYE